MLATEKTLQQERFRIIHQFGRGNQTAVYEAYDSILNANVVLAEIKGNSKTVVSTAQQLARKSAFTDKAKILTGIKHEFLPVIHDYFSETDHHYLVMEMVDGDDLSTMLANRNTPFALADVSAWADQLLDTLNYLHRNAPPVIHRHIEPQNIKLTADGKIKLLALGDAQISGAKSNDTLSTSAADDALPYLPLEMIWEGLDPASQKVILSGYDERSEKILEQPADARSDVYSVGATIYHLLTGKLPVDPLARSIEILDGNADPLISPMQLDAKIPASISDVIMRAMEIRRENRFDSAVIMRQVLRTALVRVKEKEAEETKLQVEEATQMLKAAEEKRLEQERRLFEQKRLEVEAEQQRLEEERQLVNRRKLEFEAEQKRQADIVTQQLREAEAKKLRTEQLAAEAERLLREQSAKQVDDEILELDVFDFEKTDKPQITAVKPKLAPEVVQPPTAEVVREPEKSFAAPVESPASDNELFADQQTEKRSSGKMAAIAGTVIVLVVVAVGGWLLMSSKSADAKQNTSGQTMSLSEPAKPANVEPAAPEVSPSNETAAAPAASASPETVAVSTAAPEVKNKPATLNAAAPTPRVQKQAVPTPKTPAAQPTQKKSVTVDDLINDN